MASLHRVRRLACAAIVACAAGALQASEVFDAAAGNLLAVLRESPGANKQDESLEPFGKIGMTLADGREVLFEASWFQYLGDMHLRLVFDGGQRVQSALPQDLTRLRLSPEQALAIATENLKRRYGLPVARPFSGGLMQVQADAPGLVSSYFLDREFWDAQLRQHPQGIVAAVPDRAGIVFAPAADEAALTSLRFTVAAVYATDERTRLSSALYLYKAGHWSVFQPPQPANH